MIDRFLNWGDHGKPKSSKIKGRCLWRGILDKNVIGSYHKVHYIEFACILSYRTRYAVMSYSVMLYCNRNTVLSYSVTLHRNQNSIVSYSDADVSYPVVIYRNLYAVASYSVTRYRNLNGIVSYPMLLYRTRCYYVVPEMWSAAFKVRQI